MYAFQDSFLKFSVAHMFHMCGKETDPLDTIFNGTTYHGFDIQLLVRITVSVMVGPWKASLQYDLF